MEGTWSAGTLSGAATYHQPAYQLSARYTKGVPEGPCTFTTASFRTLPGAQLGPCTELGHCKFVSLTDQS
jgi:hypothetical protein